MLNCLLYFEIKWYQPPIVFINCNKWWYFLYATILFAMAHLSSPGHLAALWCDLNLNIMSWWILHEQWLSVALLKSALQPYYHKVEAGSLEHSLVTFYICVANNQWADSLPRHYIANIRIIIIKTGIKLSNIDDEVRWHLYIKSAPDLAVTLQGQVLYWWVSARKT